MPGTKLPNLTYEPVNQQKFTLERVFEQGGKMTQRSEARLAGYTYLGYIVFAMSASILSSKTTTGLDTPQMLATLQSMIWTARVTVLLDLLQIICALLLAVTLYRLSNAVDATLALFAMCFRVGEGLLGFLPLLGKLELMNLATASGKHCVDSSGCLALASEIHHRPDDVFSQFCFVVGGFVFAYLFLSGRLIPRWLAWIGLMTIGLQLICVALYIATIVPGSIVNWLWLPILLYEVPLGLWLIGKGIQARV